MRRRVRQKAAESMCEAFFAAVTESALKIDVAQREAMTSMALNVGNGFYLWGDPGRGKTALSSLYFNAIPTASKRRFHFHEFFAEIDHLIASARGTVDDAIDELISGVSAIMFDEFHVHDVADAIYLTATLRRIARDGTLFIATSNYPPQQLLPNPLMHDRFQQAIDLIEREYSVIWIGEGDDYRRCNGPIRHGFASGTWSSTESEQITRMLPTQIDMNGGSVEVLHNATAAAVTFAELCERPLGMREYLALTERFREITLRDVPDLALVDREPLQRLGNLVDICCDRDIVLNIVSQGTPRDILRAKRSPPDAARTISRLSMLRPTANTTHLDAET